MNTSMQLEFGNKEHIKLRKQRKRKKKEEDFGEIDKKSLIQFELCRKCAELQKLEILRPSDMFRICCDGCKGRFMEVANKRSVIGGLVRIINNKK